MFPPLAWLRALAFAFLFFASRSHAREETISTSSVTYCAPPESLLIQRFDVTYFTKNQSVSFDVSAASVQAGVNVTANLFVNVYGLNPINITIDLCNILGGALCPLPMYNFTGSDSLALPASLGVQSRIPGIAFKIPDLEGFAQLTLTDVKTGAVRACVQATLSNGWSARQPAVEWSTGGVALLFLLLAIAYTALFPPTTDLLLPTRLLDLLGLFQAIASSAFLNLNYPSVYPAFALNFAWAVGLFSTPGGGLQSSIDHMRHLTGGTLANASEGSAVGLVNRKLSPYNVPPTTNTVIIPGFIQARGVVDALLDLDFPSVGGTLQSLAKRAVSATNGNVQTVTAQSANVLQAGVPIYVNSIHIATANAFMTVFIVALIMFAIALGVFILGYGLTLALQRVRGRKAALNYPSFVRAWTVRLCLVALFPLLIFIFYQWTLKDSWLSILLSVLTFLFLLAFMVYPSLRILRVARHTSPEELYAPSTHLASYGAHYAHYRPPRFYFFLPLLVALFLKALFIAVVTNGLAQVILVLVVEAFLVAAHIVLRPHRTRGADVFGTFLALVRLVCTGLLIAFVQHLQVKAIPRVAIGIVAAVIYSVAVVIVVINLAMHTVLPLWRRWKGAHSSSSSSSLSSTLNSKKSMMEKGLAEPGRDEKGLSPTNAEVSHAPSWEHVGRPVNPTPEHNVPLDPYLLEPYPISPTGTSISVAEPPSLYSRSSATMTVGSLLPRRWSFSHSQPCSPSAASSLSHARRDSATATSSSGHGHQRDSNVTSALPSPMGMVAEEEAPAAQHPPSSAKAAAET